MAVYFVYRCAYLGPTARYVRRFDDVTVLDWFRRTWRPFTDYDPAQTYANELLGVKVYSTGDIFFDREEPNPPRPDSLEGIEAAFSRTYHNEMCCEEHCVQVLTDDDEIDMVYYLFDDVFVEKHGDLTAYLLHEGPLPDGEGSRRWKSNHPAVEKQKAIIRRRGKGRIYASSQKPYDSCWHEDMGPGDVDLLAGLRLADLCRQLMTMTAEELEERPHPFGELREALFANDLVEEGEERAFLDDLRADPRDESTWRVYADWLTDHDKPAPGLRLLRQALLRLAGGAEGDDPGARVQVGEHIAQACLDADDGDHDQWFAFDDLWGSAHPVLANAMLRYATRWDVLSTGNERRSE